MGGWLAQAAAALHRGVGGGAGGGARECEVSFSACSYPRRLDTRQGSWRGPPGLSAKEIPVGKVQGTATERRSQFQPLSDSLGIYEG